MKNISAIIIVLALIVLGVFLFKGDKEDIDINDEVEQEENAPVSNTMPVLGEEGVGIKETIVVGEEKIKEFTVEGKNFSFAPSTITVNKGDKVKIIFKNTQGFHDFVIDEYGAATKQAQAPAEEILEFTADKSGSFEFYCSVGTHRQMGMKGTFIVK